jgi:hypothetical protein
MSTLDPDTARLIEEEAEHAEVTRDEPYPPGMVAERRSRTRATVYSVRLSDDEVAAIQRLAESTGVPRPPWSVPGSSSVSVAAQKRDRGLIPLSIG